MLLEREQECRVLELLLAGVRDGSSGVLVLRGEAGIGKTALLEHAVRAADMPVARAAGVESEMELGFAGLHQLLVPLLDRLGSLPGPQREALGTVFGLAPVRRRTGSWWAWRRCAALGDGGWNVRWCAWSTMPSGWTRTSPCWFRRRAPNRPLSRGLGDKRQRREANQKPIRHRMGRQPEHGAQRLPLRRGQVPQPALERHQQLMQPREAEFHLRLHPHRPGHLHIRGALHCMLQESGLADPRLSPQHEDTAQPVPYACEQALKLTALLLPFQQHRELIPVLSLPQPSANHLDGLRR